MVRQIKNHAMIIIRISVAVILCISVCFPSAVASTNQSAYSNQSKMAYTMHKFDNTLSPIYEVNTRIKEIPFNSSALVNFTLTKFGSSCPPESPFTFMDTIETMPRPQKSLIEYKHH